jgi:hypothetical protein
MSQKLINCEALESEEHNNSYKTSLSGAFEKDMQYVK